MLLTYGLTYGYPASMNVAFPFWPMHQQIRETLISRGYNPNAFPMEEENPITNILQNGLQSYIIEQIVGDTQNVAELWTPSMTIFKDLMDGDKSWYEIAGGASGTTILDVLAATQPFIYSILSLVDDEAYPLTKEDWMGILQTQRGMDVASRGIQSLSLGKLFNKRGEELGDIHPGEGLGLIFMGSIPQRLSDMYKFMGNQRDLKKLQKLKGREAEKFLRLSVTAEDETDRIKYRQRAAAEMKLGQFSLDQRANLIRRALSDKKDLIGRLIKDAENMTPEMRDLFFKTIRGTSTPFNERDED
jgi:hypothetical protein